MDRDGRWNRGRGHARVSGDCSHWLENRVKRGETWQGFGGRGENRGWPMSINGSPSTACLPFSPPLFPVHNNFDSRAIIAFSKQVFPKKYTSSLGWRFPIILPFIDWRTASFLNSNVLSLSPLLCIRFRLIVKFLVFFFFFPTISLYLVFISVVSTLDYIFFRLPFSLTTIRLFLILLFPLFPLRHNLLSSFFDRALCSCIVWSKDSIPSFEPHLFTFCPFYLFISLFSLFFQKKNSNPKQILYLSPHALHLSAVVKISQRPRASRFPEIEISSPENRILSFRSLDTFRKFISPSDWSDAIKSTGPIWPEIVSFWLTGGWPRRFYRRKRGSFRSSRVSKRILWNRLENSCL